MYERQLVLNDAFLGIGGADEYGDLYFQTEMGGYMCDNLLPLSDEEFKETILRMARSQIPLAKFLGPSLASRLILCAPLLDLVTDFQQEIVQLPEGLEPYDEALVHRMIESDIEYPEDHPIVEQPLVEWDFILR